MSKLKYEGEVFKMNNYGELVITKYVSAKEVRVRFLVTGYETSVQLVQIRLGRVKDKLSPTVFGVGVTGDESTVDNIGNTLKEYKLWNKMLQRSFDLKLKTKYQTYMECNISDFFKYYKNFKEWCNKQKGFNQPTFELDKDLLSKGNKIYSEDTCVFLPHELNSLLVRSESSRGKYIIGACYEKVAKKFRSQVHINGKQKFLGYYDTPEEAFKAYKHEKERRVKELAEKWKDDIDPRAYSALINYGVEIDD